MGILKKENIPAIRFSTRRTVILRPKAEESGFRSFASCLPPACQRSGRDRQTLRMTGILLGILTLFLFSNFPVVQADTAFLRQLVDKPAANFGDAVFVFTQFLNQGAASSYSDFEAQKNFLQEKGVLSNRLAAKSAETAIRKGELAEFAIKALENRGGIVLRLVRPWSEKVLGNYLFQRYALREAIFLQWMTEEDIRSFVSGMELLSTLSKMSEYRSGE